MRGEGRGIHLVKAMAFVDAWIPFPSRLCHSAGNDSFR